MATPKKSKSLLQSLRDGTLTLIEKIGILTSLGSWAQDHVSFAEKKLELAELDKNSEESEIEGNIETLYNWAYDHVSFSQVLGHVHGDDAHETSDEKLEALITWANENVSFTEKIN